MRVWVIAIYDDADLVRVFGVYSSADLANEAFEQLRAEGYGDDGFGHITLEPMPVQFSDASPHAA